MGFVAGGLSKSNKISRFASTIKKPRILIVSHYESVFVGRQGPGVDYHLYIVGTAANSIGFCGTTAQGFIQIHGISDATRRQYS